MSRALMSMLAVVPLLATFAAAGEAQVDQRALALLISSESRSERAQGVREAKSLAPGEIGRGLADSLIGALERENARYYGGLNAFFRGEPAPAFHEDESDVYLEMIELVAALRDSSAIPALAGALGTGGTVRMALVAFGEEAVPEIAAVVGSPESNPRQVAGGLRTLRVMVEEYGLGAFADATLDGLREVSRRRLDGVQSVTVVWNAIDLAVALNDPALRARVASLASSRDEVVRRGVTDEDLIHRTQTRARDRLAGVPAEPGR